MASNFAIEVEGVSKSFKLPHEKHDSLKGTLIGILKGRRGFEKQEVLNDISFEIQKGEFFGIVGRNGSGKSTLLKLLAGIYTPDSGQIRVDGKLTPFIELGVGFNPELTGRENVFLNGALLGFNRVEIAQMYDEIVEFAELERFMDQKLKNYSSGMQVRLAFSIAIRANTDILVLDEVLAVGDEAFQRKCFSFFAKLKRDKKTVILVTHSMDSVQQFCTRAMLIDKGHKTEIGKPAEIAQIYRELNMPPAKASTDVAVVSSQDFVRASASTKVTDKNISLDVSIISKKDIEDASVAMIITREDGEMVYRWVLDEKIGEIINIKKDQKIELELKIQNIFPNGKYSVRLAVRKRDRSEDYTIVDNIASYEIVGKKNDAPYWKPKEEFKVKN